MEHLRVFIWFLVISIITVGYLHIDSNGVFLGGLWQKVVSQFPQLDTKKRCPTEIPGSTAQDYREAALKIEATGNLNCAITYWQKVVDKRPTDVSDLANLAMRLTQAERYTEALPYYERTLQLGGGYYDLFAWYARNFRQLGRQQEAIDWYYRTLSVNSLLADITEELSQLLVMNHQHYEALNLLSGFAEKLGAPNRFKANLIAIQTTLASNPETNKDRQVFRTAKLGDEHFYVLVKLTAQGANHAFMVDTGATMVSFDEAFLEDHQVDYQTTKKVVKMKVADGRTIRGNQIKLSTFQFGPHVLQNVTAVVCESCASLVGQNVLNQFDLRTEKVNGVEFMYLTRR